MKFLLKVVVFINNNILFCSFGKTLNIFSVYLKKILPLSFLTQCPHVIVEVYVTNFNSIIFERHIFGNKYK